MRPSPIIAAPDPAPPRRTARALPSYRYVPGLLPHPTKDDFGHHAMPDPTEVAAFDPAAPWDDQPAFAYALDLLDQRYWWECHEHLEALWRAVDRPSPAADLLQGLICLAASRLKQHLGDPRSAERLLAKANARLDRAEEQWVGTRPRYHREEPRLTRRRGSRSRARRGRAARR